MRCGCCGGGLNFETPDRMIHFNDPPDGEEAHPRPTTSAPPPDELSVEQPQAIIRSSRSVSVSWTHVLDNTHVLKSRTVLREPR